MAKKQIEFAKKFLEIRRNSGLTQDELAEKSGVSQATIARIEAGGPPTLDNFRKLCEALIADPYEVAVLFPHGSEIRSAFQHRPRLLGVLAAGEGRDEEITQPARLEFSDYLPDGCVSYIVRGDSMRDEAILDGDFILVRPDPVPKIGEKVVVFVPDRGTLLKVKRKDYYASADGERAPIPWAEGCYEYGVYEGIFRTENRKRNGRKQK